MNEISDNLAVGSDALEFMDSLLTAEEIAESDMRVASFGELIKERFENGNKLKENL